jgi:hypothetical protein
MVALITEKYKRKYEKIGNRINERKECRKIQKKGKMQKNTKERKKWRKIK